MSTLYLHIHTLFASQYSVHMSKLCSHVQSFSHVNNIFTHSHLVNTFQLFTHHYRVHMFTLFHRSTLCSHIQRFILIHTLFTHQLFVHMPPLCSHAYCLFTPLHSVHTSIFYLRQHYFFQTCTVCLHSHKLFTRPISVHTSIFVNACKLSSTCLNFDHMPTHFHTCKSIHCHKCTLCSQAHILFTLPHSVHVQTLIFNKGLKHLFEMH